MPKIIGFQELSILWKYDKFWLSYEQFSALYDILLPKLAISSLNWCEIVMELKSLGATN